MWAEWLACGPLILFIILNLPSRPAFLVMDFAALFSFFLCLFCGFLLILELPLVVRSILLALSFVFYAPSLFLTAYVRRRSRSVHFERMDSVAEYLHVNQLEKSILLSRYFSSTQILFVLNYLVALGGQVDPAVTVLVFQFLSMTIKGIYGAVLMDLHLDSSLLLEKLLSKETRVNHSHRAVLNSLFNDVRNPLHALSIGIEILHHSTQMDEVERESLLVMRGATEIISTALDDLVTLQKIEQGEATREEEPFSPFELVHRVSSGLRAVVAAKHLSMQISYDANIPPRLLGDEFQVGHALSSLLANAITSSPERGAVAVHVEASGNSAYIGAEGYTAEKVTLSIGVWDEGRALSQEEMDLAFCDLVDLPHGVVVSRNGSSGVGLSLCKKIMDLLDGSVSVLSEEGRGNCFSFSVPLMTVAADSTSTPSTSSSLVSHTSHRTNWIRSPRVATIQSDDENGA